LCQVLDVMERPRGNTSPDHVANRLQNMADVHAILPLTAGGLDVNVRFTT
jgi:hypothetical protein